MSRQLKPLTFSRLEDLTLGSFALVPTSETINHLVRYLSTWSGTEYVLLASWTTYSLMDTLIDSKLFMARPFALPYKCSGFHVVLTFCHVDYSVLTKNCHSLLTFPSPHTAQSRYEEGAYERIRSQTRNAR